MLGRPRRASQALGPVSNKASKPLAYLSIAVGTPITGRPPHRTRFPGPVSGTCSIGSRSPRPLPFAPPPPLPVARRCSAASLLLWRSLTSHARALSASVPHLPDADQPALQPVAGHEISQVPTRSFSDVMWPSTPAERRHLA